MGLILIALIYRFKKRFWIYVLIIGMSWGLADLVSTKIFKKNIKRLRPCHSELHKDAYMPHPEGCGGKYGFVSSHAANSAALATVVIIVMAHWTKYIMILWSLLICYTRIYLGKHYPADVVAGALLGIVCALTIYLLYKYMMQKYFIKSSPR